MALLAPPSVVLKSAWSPKALLLRPVVLFRRALRPKAVLPLPVVFFWSAFEPPAVFPLVSLRSLMVGFVSPQLTAPPSVTTRPATPTTVLTTLFIDSSLAVHLGTPVW